MKFYIHPINPHFAGTHADDYFAGWAFGIWEHPYPATEPGSYRYQSKHLEAARDTQQRAEEMTLKLPDAPVQGTWLRLPEGVDAHSATAANTTLAMATSQCRPVAWPWTDAQHCAA
ncbi:hypothetical protein [Burkholderia cenocepacia]|uniref:hypothetical protein n=1 Tax=Burkholderia cenocepacia TaxID=95486 RepID=UPI0007618F85|nr:hypothetical protein [Burkholderia cenocepacia]KWU26300.1 hypothetical protein AS149_25245 [Burkholderia cenocepacia]